MTAVTESSVLEPEIDQEPSLEELKQMVDPKAISFFSGGGASTFGITRSARDSILNVTNPGILRELLRHTETLRTPQEKGFTKEFPIDLVKNAIIRRLEELRV